MTDSLLNPEWTGRWLEDVTCDCCREGWFIAESGMCTTQSCREWNDELDCIECNVVPTINYKVQESECVSKCEFPYNEIYPDVCGIDCNYGHYITENGCRACSTADCRYCLPNQQCFYCMFGEECDLDCSSLEHSPLHDFNPHTGVSKCASDCDHDAAIASFWAPDNSGIATPRCRYCSDDCLECKEDDESHDLHCTKCPMGMLIEADDCVDECSSEYQEDHGFCVYVGPQ